MYVKSIDASINIDTLSGKSVHVEYEFYGNVSVNSLAGIFDLKDRIRFNKQFLKTKKLLKSNTLQSSIESNDTSLTVSSMIDSISTDSTNLYNNTPSTTDSTLENTGAITLDSVSVLQSDTTSVVAPDSANVLQSDTTSVVAPDSVAVKKE